MCALLYPFLWTFTFIPILPVHILQVEAGLILGSPQPFIYGVSKDLMARIDASNLEDVVQVDLASNNVRFPSSFSFSSSFFLLLSLHSLRCDR